MSSIVVMIVITGCGRPGGRIEASSGAAHSPTGSPPGPGGGFCAGGLSQNGVSVAPVTDGARPRRSANQVIAEAESALHPKPWFSVTAAAYFASVREYRAPKPGLVFPNTPRDRWVVELTLSEGNARTGGSPPTPAEVARDIVLVDDEPETAPPRMLSCPLAALPSSSTTSTSTAITLPAGSPTWSGPRHQVVSVFGPQGEAVGLDVGDDCATVTDAGRDAASVCGASAPPPPGPRQWTPIQSGRLPGRGWFLTVEVGAEAATLFGVAPDGSRTRGVLSPDGWGLVVSASGDLRAQVYDLAGQPLESTKPSA